MRAMWKFQLPVAVDIEVKMPRGSYVVEVASQNNVVTLWALCPTDEDFVARRFSVFATGDTLPPMNLHYVGTAHTRGGALVWHVFEAPS